MPDVILVNEFDEEIGTMEKMEVHQKALLHRAFSIFIFNSKGEMLLQQRSFEKYHNPGLWSNTCCSHPQPGEEISDAAAKRLLEEMGFTTNLERSFSFTYKATFDNGLTEHEFDHVFTGVYDGAIKINSEEVNAAKFCTLEEIETDLTLNPETFTAWFRLGFPRVKNILSDNKK